MTDLDEDIGFLTLRSRIPSQVDALEEVSLGKSRVSEQQALYSVIGASVAVCLFDSVTGMVGMCHVMLPSQFGHHRDDAMLKADSALESLCNQLKEASPKSSMKAKLFGGAELSQTGFTFSDGKQSSIFSRTWLRTRNIMILAESLGGNRRREIVLIPGSGQVFCKQVSMSSDFLQREREDLLSQAAPLNNVELF